MQKHGTLTRYNTGCRCDGCKEARIDYYRRAQAIPVEHTCPECGKQSTLTRQSVLRIKSDVRSGVCRSCVNRKRHRSRDYRAGFWEKVAIRQHDECWEWQGTKIPHGYGRVAVYGEQILAHRVAYELCVGEIPDGLQIDHLCFNRACVNPFHLEAVTASENMRRAYRRKRELATA